jgi:hypothetical protein
MMAQLNGVITTPALQYGAEALTAIWSNAAGATYGGKARLILQNAGSGGTAHTGGHFTMQVFAQ